MSDSTIAGASGDRTVTAFFDTGDHAETAKRDLVAAGLPESAITIVGSNADHFTVAADHHQGFWDALTNFFMPEEDRRAYAEGLRRGGFALSVRTTAALYDAAIDVLDRDGAVDLDERELSWESEGWSRPPQQQGIDNLSVDPSYQRPDAGTAGFGASHAGEDGIAHVDEATNPDVRERIGAGSASQTAPAPTGGPQTYAHPATPLDDTLSDAAAGRADDGDSLFGRRDLTHGRNRVRSYIVDGVVNR